MVINEIKHPTLSTLLKGAMRVKEHCSVALLENVKAQHCQLSLKAECTHPRFRLLENLTKAFVSMGIPEH